MLVDYTFQENAVNDIIDRLFVKNESAVLLVSPTGSGKTVITGKAAKKIISLTDGKVLAILSLQTLVKQTYREFESLGIKVSVVHNEIVSDEKGDFNMGYDGDVVITMPETFCNIIEDKTPEFVLPKGFAPSLLWVDEAHNGTSEMFQTIRNFFEQTKVLGTTATPYRENNKEGEHIRSWYGMDYIYTISVGQLIEIGKLVRPEYLVYDNTASEVQEWKKVMQGRKNKQTVVFTANTDASYKYLKAFTDAGIKAEVITAGSDNEIDGKVINAQTVKQRDEINARFERGEITVLISVRALCEGWNVERTVCCVLARKVGNPALYDQMVGRVMRAWEGDNDNARKTDCIVMDFCNNVRTHGYVEDRDWDKEGEGRSVAFASNKPMSESKFAATEVVRHVCEHCHKVYNLKDHRVCPNVDCGEPSGFKVVSTVKKFFTTYFKATSVVQINNIVKYVCGISGKEDAAILAHKLNVRYGHQILDEDGNLTEQFAGLKDLLGKTVKLSDKIDM